MTKKSYRYRFDMPKKKCPCDGQYISPSGKKCPGYFYTLNSNRRSWMPGCLNFASKPPKARIARPVRYCTKSENGCGRSFRGTEDQILCPECASKKGFSRTDFILLVTGLLFLSLWVLNVIFVISHIANK